MQPQRVPENLCRLASIHSAWTRVGRLTHSVHWSTQFLYSRDPLCFSVADILCFIPIISFFFFFFAISRNTSSTPQALCVSPSSRASPVNGACFRQSVSPKQQKTGPSKHKAEQNLNVKLSFEPWPICPYSSSILTNHERDGEDLEERRRQTLIMIDERREKK